MSLHSLRRGGGCLLAGVLLAVFYTLSAQAQAAKCSNPSIDSAFNTSLHRAPNGSGIAGECNPDRYGGGVWNSQADLDARVLAATFCADPWIGQIYLNFYSRRPTSDECNTDIYGGWPWTSYMDLATRVKTYQDAAIAAAKRLSSATNPRAPQGQYLVAPNGSLVDSNGAVIAAPETYLIATGTDHLIVPEAGMVIATEEDPAAQPSLNSESKRIIAGTIVKR